MPTHPVRLIALGGACDTALFLSLGQQPQHQIGKNARATDTLLTRQTQSWLSVRVTDRRHQLHNASNVCIPVHIHSHPNLINHLSNEVAIGLSGRLHDGALVIDERMLQPFDANANRRQ